jgi:hypothetical protein
MEIKKVKQVLWGVGTCGNLWERGGYKERVKEDERSGNIKYSCMKAEK